MPVLRLLLPFISGILLQWYCQPGPSLWELVALVSFTLIALFFFLSFSLKFRWAAINGLLVNLLFLATGAMLTRQQDIRNNANWFMHHYQPGDTYLLSLDEPPVEKPRSLKAKASLRHTSRQQAGVKGQLIVYFKKDDSVSLQYGTRLLTRKPLQPIKNAGNPGSFDYAQYCLFNGITHQVYLQAGDYIILPGLEKNWLGVLLYSVRDWVLETLRHFILNEQALGLAEALLIGYKDDLDKTIVQSYSNTGVVHIIAISGLHLGLIYWLLLKLVKPLKKLFPWLPALIIITSLWLFSLLAGAQPSVLRSAVMFTCIVVGENLIRKSSVFNTLALSAFILLAYNPFWLWDTGFQLSYSAVLSIILFMQPVYHWFYIKNKALDGLWKLNAVTISAQLLTTPLTVYYFHQFPNCFLLTNLLAVPLSSAILLCEIFLCCISFLPGLAELTGRLCTWMIHGMNGYIQHIEAIPFSVWPNLLISPAQAILLLLFIISLSYGLLQKAPPWILAAFGLLVAFTLLRSRSFYEASYQEQLIVYNIPRQSAMDIFIGRHCYEVIDSALLANQQLYHLQLAPSRILHRAAAVAGVNGLYSRNGIISWRQHRILRVDGYLSPRATIEKVRIDLLILGQQARVSLATLSHCLEIRQLVFDSSLPAWKIPTLTREADSLHIPWHDVSEKGAFVMRLR